MSDEKIQILLLAACPLGQKQLKLDEELRDVRAAVRMAKYRDQVEIVTATAVRRSDLQREIEDSQPAIVHFCGHGSFNNELVLCSDEETEDRVHADELRLLFGSFRDVVRLVVFNACYSDGEAAAVVEHVDAAIGMSRPISDPVAIKFAKGFYQAIADAKTIGEALDLGCFDAGYGGPRGLSYGNNDGKSISKFSELVLFERNGVDGRGVKLVMPCEIGGRRGELTAKPPPLTFTGRDELRRKLVESLKSGSVGLFNAVGDGGVGKTALARRVAQDLAGHFEGGQFEIDFLGGAKKAEQKSAQDALIELMREILPSDFALDDGARLRATYRDELRRRPMLILCDNVASGEQLASLSPPPDGSALLITSRNRLAISGCPMNDISRLDRNESIDLLRRLLPDVGFKDSLLDPLADACGDLPLAIEVAAKVVRATARNVDDVIDDLKVARTELECGDQANDLVYCEVEASLKVSLRILRGKPRIVWRHLAVFPADFDADAARAVANPDGDGDVDRALGVLIERSLLERDQQSGRYRMHEMVRDFASRELASKKEVEGAIDRFVAHFTHVLRSADKLYSKHGNRIHKGLALYDREASNIGVAYTMTSARLPDKTGNAAISLIDLIAGGALVLSQRLQISTCITWQETALAAAPTALQAEPTSGRERSVARLAGNLGVAYAKCGKLDQAEKVYLLSLKINERLGQPDGIASIYGNLGLLYATRGELNRAEKMYRKSLEIEKRLGNWQGIASDYGNIGVLFVRRGELDRAEEMYRKALEIDERLENLPGMASDYGNLGNLYAMRGESDRAEEMYQNCLQIEARLERPDVLAGVYCNLGSLYADRGEMERACLSIRQARDLFSQIGITDKVETMDTLLKQMSCG